MRKLLSSPAQIVTVDTNGKNIKRGSELGSINVIYNHSILIENGIIKDIIPNSKLNKVSYNLKIDLKNKIILPGLVESHTHTAYAGSRADEFRMKLNGVNYEEIANSGGGINKTVSAVRNSSEETLIHLIAPRVRYFISQGITTLEIKSGYGLDVENELKLLRVINYLNSIFPIDIIPTFLGAHTFPPEFKNNHQEYVDLIINEMIPKIAENKLAIFCDAFCESTAFSAEHVNEIFNSATTNGMKLKLHTEQFNNIGGLQIALNHNATSVDHLEVISEDDINLLSKSDTVCTLLPGVSFFLDYDYAPARKLIDNNAIVSLATDYNPGSSFISNLNFIMSLACIKMEMTPEETISAVTINSAKALELSSDRGSIEIDKKADFSIFDTNDFSDISYQVGKNLNCMTIKNGEIIFQSA